MKLKETFGTIPQQYDKDRLDYPAPLFRDVLKYAKLKKNDRILEIGIGTGKATRPFAKLGNPLLANDLSKSMVAVAKLNLKQHKNVRYKVGLFEKIKLPKNQYSLVYSAQAFHWIKPGPGLKKILSILKTNGAVAMFWNWNYYDKGVGKMAFMVHRKFSRAKGMKANTIIEKIQQSKYFKDQKLRTYQRVIRMSQRDYIEMQKSFSWYLALSHNRKTEALQDLYNGLKKFDDPLLIPIRTKLILARKK